jgi:non-specific serine/threonine protein kinase
LAAPRLRSMSVDELSERLDQRFALLSDGSRAALSRHRTLRSMLDWSYNLLNEGEQAMLRRVAVFAGGWTLTNAEQVCTGDGIDASDVCGQLTSLVDKSMVVTDERLGATRYRILETVRQYALDRLRERDDEAHWRGRHLAHFFALAEEFREAQAGPRDDAKWLARIASEHDNLRAALAWAAESSPVEGLLLAGALSTFWRLSVHLTEGRDWLARLLDAAPIDRPTHERARGLNVAGLLAILQSDYAGGRRQMEDSLALSREIGDPNQTARVLSGLAWLSIEQGHYPEAEAPSREVVDCARATGDHWLLFAGLGYLAIAIHSRGEWVAARELHERRLAVARELLGAPRQIADALNDFGRAESDQGFRDLAREHFAEALTLLHGLGNRPNVVESLEGLAGLASAAAAPRRAARLWGAADALRQEMGGTRSVHLSIAFERHVKPVRAMLTTEAFDQSWDEGRAMSLDDAVRYALDEQGEPGN